MELPGLCYGVRIESGCQIPLLELGCLAVFSKTEGAALEDIYAVGVQEEIPFIGKWMQKESLEGSASSRRKVFMVPTPLHIPDSKISPIAPSLHHFLLFKDLANPKKLRLIPASKILYDLGYDIRPLKFGYADLIKAGFSKSGEADKK